MRVTSRLYVSWHILNIYGARVELEKRLPWLGIKEKLDEGDNKSGVTAVSTDTTDGERMAPASMPE